MPMAAPSPCCQPGCGVLVKRSERYCAEHKRAVYRQIDARRGSSADRGYGHIWRSRVRPSVLSVEPLCRMCKANGLIVAAAEVDHIDGNSLNNDRDNLRPLCKRCHSARTARDQGFAQSRART